jgi:alpha-N-arabinofuranosidase
VLDNLSTDSCLIAVLAVYDGLSLNGDVTPRNKLQRFIDDALDEIEFVRGSADSKWGAVRASLGHPEPFNLEYVEVGNEDWLAGGDLGWNSYANYRFPMFQKAINKAYPDIEVLYSGSNWDSSSEGNFHPPKNPAIGDYHPYREPDALVEEFDRFDNVTVRHIVGEVAAVHVNNGTEWEGDLQPFPWWIGTVGEAISMIGYERNADRVLGTFYAPVLRNMNRWQWSITLLQFAADPALTTRSTSWYVWSLFAHHPITHTLPVESKAGYGPVYYGAGMDEERGGAMVWKGAVYNTTRNRNV